METKNYSTTPLNYLKLNKKNCYLQQLKFHGKMRDTGHADTESMPGITTSPQTQMTTPSPILFPVLSALQ